MDPALELEPLVEDRHPEEPALEVAGQHRAGHREPRVVRPRERVRPGPPVRGEPGVERPGGDLAQAEEIYRSCLAVAAERGLRDQRAMLLCVLGSLESAERGPEERRDALVQGRDLAREIGAPTIEVRARCELALLPGGDAGDALAAFAEHGERLGDDERRMVRLLLWRATGDRAHLEEAKRLLDEHLARNPPEYHEGMLVNVPINREIVAACKEQGL